MQRQSKSSREAEPSQSHALGLDVHPEESEEAAVVGGSALS